MSHTKIKLDHRSKYKSQTIKLNEENIGPCVRQRFLKKKPQITDYKGKKKLLDFIKIKKVCFTTDYAKKMEKKSQTIYK